MSGVGRVPAHEDGSVRVLEHNLSTIEDLLGASRFALVDRSVEFIVPPRAGRPARRLSGELGDWLVRDDDGQWVIMRDVVSPAAAAAGEMVAEHSRPGRAWVRSVF